MGSRERLIATLIFGDIPDGFVRGALKLACPQSETFSLQTLHRSGGFRKFRSRYSLVLFADPYCSLELDGLLQRFHSIAVKPYVVVIDY